MNAFEVKSLRDKIEERRSEFPCVRPYMHIYGIAAALRRESDPKSKGFLTEVERCIAAMEALIREQSSLVVPDPESIVPTVGAGLEMSLDPEFDEVGKYLAMLVAYRIGGDGESFGKTALMFLLLAIIGLARRDPRTWRYKAYAKELRGILEDTEAPKEVYEGLIAFYKEVLDYRSAEDAAFKGALALYGSERKSSACLYRDGLACRMQLEEEMPSVEAISQSYGELSSIVMGYPRFAAMKLDPVMGSEEFQAVYDEVMEEATDLYEQGAIKHVLVMWSNMEEGFAKRGIAWKSPSLLNPDMRFD